jgi:hypothetical protein
MLNVILSIYLDSSSHQNRINYISAADVIYLLSVWPQVDFVFSVLAITNLLISHPTALHLLL